MGVGIFGFHSWFLVTSCVAFVLSIFSCHHAGLLATYKISLSLLFLVSFVFCFLLQLLVHGLFVSVSWVGLIFDWDVGVLRTWYIGFFHLVFLLLDNPLNLFICSRSFQARYLCSLCSFLLKFSILWKPASALLSSFFWILDGFLRFWILALKGMLL